MPSPLHLAASVLLVALLPQGAIAQPVRTLDYVTRAETVMSLILARSPDFPAVKNEGKFSDIPKGAWFEPTMLLGEKYGIISADAKGLLKPQESVNRAEFLKMLTLTFGLPLNITHTYEDVPVNSWFAQYAGVAQRYKIFGTPGDLLEPRKVLTRAEMLTAIRTFERVRQREPDIHVEQGISKEQSDGQLRIYNVISTRKVRVTLIDQKPAQTVTARKVAIPPSLPELRTKILEMVNEIRIEHDLTPLTYNALLEQSAQGYADRMADEGFFAHVSPDGDTLKDRISRVGYYNRSFSDDCFCVKGYALGENLARGQKTAKEAVDAWMKSPAHRDAILNGDYSELGVGVSAGVWVQHFGGVLLPQR